MNDDPRWRRKEELERLKRDLDLIAYAKRRGYYVDEKQSSPRGNPTNWILRRDLDDDKLLACRTAQCWVYRSLRDDTDRGTVLDFAQKILQVPRGPGRTGLSSAAVADLRAYAGDPSAPGPDPRPPAPPPAPRDRSSVVSRFVEAREVVISPYLVATRCIRPETLRDPRFARTWRQDRAGNVLFPHYDRQGLCGYDIRGPEHKIFSPAGTKGIWHSRLFVTDSKLVVSEAPIDALSYHQMNPDPAARYISTSGNVGAVARQLVARAIAKMPAGATTVIAHDNDRGGEQFAGIVEKLAGGRPTVRHPSPEGKDWNRLVQLETRRARAPTR